jgi:hypothetical protein
MKAYTMLATGLLLVSVPAVGQSSREALQHDTPYVLSMSTYSDGYIQRAVKNYAMDLNSSNEGVVESAIAHVTYLRIGMPQVDLSAIRTSIADLAESGRTPVIRYKAYLATLVFESPSSFVNVLKTESNEGGLFFSGIASQIQKTLLGQNMQ